MKIQTTKYFFLLLIFISINSVGQNKIDRDQKDIELIISSYKKHSYASENIKQTMVRYRDINKILLLKNYSNEIVESFDVKYFDEKDYYFLCFLNSLPDSIINMALKNKSTPLIFKAKYGDSICTQKLLDQIEQYFFADNNEEINDTERLSYAYISYLYLLNTDRAKNILYKVFETTKYTTTNLYDGRQDYRISLSYIAIGYYMNFNPPNCSISNINPQQFEVLEGKPIFSENEINQEDFNQYKRDVETYISQMEKHKVEIKTTFFNIGEYRIEKYRW
jgi:hypothetical protein